MVDVVICGSGHVGELHIWVRGARMDSGGFLGAMRVYPSESLKRDSGRIGGIAFYIQCLEQCL